MKRNKKAQIWLDYSVAYITQLRNNQPETMIVKPANALSNERDNGQSHIPYWAELSDIISACDEVVLYGPTNAKQDLLQILRANYLYAGIKIALQPAGNMSGQQEFFRSSCAEMSGCE
jgi:hypothetical protein